MVYLLGALGYALVVVLLGGAAHAGALLGAHWIGGKPFRWFDAAPAAVSLGRSVAVRALSVVGALLLVFCLKVVGNLAGGKAEPTLNVDVAPGPAERAGVQSGDRILSVDDAVLGDWDELRREIRRRGGERRLEVERAGKRLSLSVTPQDGRIGVTPRYERHPTPLSSALTEAGSALWAYPTAMLKTAFSSTERTEIMGPVAVVKSVGRGPGESSRLALLGAIGVIFWPLVLGIHAFDALTLWLFRATHKWASTAETDTARRARFFQTSLLCGLGEFAYVVLLAIQEGAALGNGAMPGILALGPIAVSGIVLATIAARWRFGLGAAIGIALASITIPCAVFVFLGLAAYWQYAELRRRGYEVRWLVVLPRGAS